LSKALISASDFAQLSCRMLRAESFYAGFSRTKAEVESAGHFAESELIAAPSCNQPILFCKALIRSYLPCTIVLQYALLRSVDSVLFRQSLAKA
jgi:hypothetical protein